MQRVLKSDEAVKSRKLCSVPQCTTYCTPDISLHKFPGEPKAVEKWKNILKIGKPISKYMLVCSKHFMKEDFHWAKSKRMRLKKGACPSLNLPISSCQNITKKKDRSERSWLNRKPLEVGSIEAHAFNENQVELEDDEEYMNKVVMESPIKEFESVAVMVDGNEFEMSPGTSTLPPNYHPPLNNVFYEDKSTQTDFCDFFELPQILTNDEKLSHFTGVDHKVLDVYTTCSKNLALHNDVSEKNIKLWLVLVLCKLKTNLSFACLAVLFGISNSTCSRMFYSMISILARSIKPAIYWPSKEEVLKNMPKCFDAFRNTRVVLDCTEVKVQTLKCLNCRILSYSHYKRMHTMKFLIGITPSGLISYISPAYGGRASDKAIFNSEQLIKKMDPYDAVMVDKGVLIGEECTSHFVKLIQPPFLRKKKQLSKEESTTTAQIARARIHVERAIQRIKLFAILNDQIDWYLIPYIDDIMTVVAASVNMSRPILADEKF